MNEHPYSDTEFLQVQAALAQWINMAGDCGYYHPGNLAHWMYAVLRGSRPIGDLVRLWRQDGEIVGIAINYLFETAFQAFIHPALRGSAAERAILESAADTTRQMMDESGRRETPVVTDVVSCDQARIEALESLGFARYRVWDHQLECPLAALPAETPLPEGFTIRHATFDDAAALAAARNEVFDGEWNATLYQDAVMRKPGYDPARELMVIAPDGRVAAFTIIWRDELNGAGLFEPVGTHPAFRRRGLARALMLSALRQMQTSGITRAQVQHDASNHAAAALYQSLGFQYKYETLGYARQAG